MADAENGGMCNTPPEEKTEETAEITEGTIRAARVTELLEKMVNRMLHNLRGSSEELQRKKREIGEALLMFVSQFVDIEMENQAQEELNHLNPLTNVLNKKGAERIFELLKIEQMRKTDEGWLVIVRLDLDNFKKVNDSRGGHALGDRVLKAVAKKLRETDILVHFSGDEFGLILPNVKPYGTKDGKSLSLDDTIKNVLTRVVRRIEEVNEDLLKETPELKDIMVTASVGYKSLAPKDLKNTAFEVGDSLADKAAGFSKTLKGTGLPGAQRIVGFDENKDEILKNLGETEASLAAARFAGQISRAAQEAKSCLPTDAQKELDKKIEEIKELIEQNFKPSN